MSERTCIVPGSFDPITNGHMDIIARASKIFDRVIVAVLKNARKQSMFTVSERLEFIAQAAAGLPNVQADSFEGLLVDFARAKGARAVVKGLRAVSDFEYEMQMALLNHSLAPDVETFFLMTSAQYSFVSSSLIREAGALGGRIDEWVPKAIVEDVYRRLRGE